MPQIGKQVAALQIQLLKIYPLTADSTTPGSYTVGAGIQVAIAAEIQAEPGQVVTGKWIGDNEVKLIHTIIQNMKGRFVANNIPTDALAVIMGGTQTTNANTNNSATGTVTPQATWTWTAPGNPTNAITAGTWTVTLSKVGSTYAMQATLGGTTYTSDYTATLVRTYSFAGTAAAGLTIAVSAAPGSPADGAAVGTVVITNSSAGANTSTNVFSADGTATQYFRIEALIPYVKDVSQEVGSNGKLIFLKAKFVGGPQLNFGGNPAQTAISVEFVKPNDTNQKLWWQFVAGESAQTLT